MYDSNGEILRHGKPCETNYCFECVPHNVSKVETGIHYVEPEGFVSINDVGLHHEEARARMKTFRCRLRIRSGMKIEDLYVLERYVKRGHEGLGVHMYVHGHLPEPDDVLLAAWDSGMDPHRRENAVRVDAMTHHGNLGYFFKNTESARTLKTFLDDNGGSLMSTTRGFWRLPGCAPARGGCRGLLRQARSQS